MNQSPDVRRREIATRDLLFRALLKWRIILLIAVLSAAGFLFVKMKRPAPAKNAAAGGASFDEAMEAYREERSSLEELIERSRDLLAKKRSYLSSSILLAIDPAREGRASATLIVGTPDPDSARGADAASGRGAASPEQIVDALSSFAACGLDLEAVSGELGADPALVAELISTNPSVISTSTYAAYPDAAGRTSDVPRGTLTVTVVHPDADTADKILGVVLGQIEAKSAELASSFAPHTLTVAARGSGYAADTSIGSRSENLLQELYMLSTNEERLESQLTSLKKPSESSHAEASLPVRTIVLYALLGFICGGLLALLIIMVILTFSGRVLSASEMNHLLGLKKLAVIPDEKVRRSPLDRLIARLDSDGKNAAEMSVRCRLAAESLSSKESAGKNYLLISSLPKEELEKCASRLRTSLSSTEYAPHIETAPNLSDDPDSLKMLGRADGAVLVEKIGVSRYSSISNILMAARAKSVPVIGSILL